MEVLNLLEQKIGQLLGETTRFKDEHSRMMANSSSTEDELQLLRQENESLKFLLEEERRKNQGVLERIDLLLERLGEPGKP